MTDKPLWKGLPVPDPTPEVWLRFSMDPRVSSLAAIPSSPDDRALAIALIEDAVRTKKLHPSKRDARIQAVEDSLLLGEIKAQIDDFVEDYGVKLIEIPKEKNDIELVFRHYLVQMWLWLSVFCVIVWAFIFIATKDANYYWPFWMSVMLAGPVILEARAQVSGKYKSV